MVMCCDNCINCKRGHCIKKNIGIKDGYLERYCLDFRLKKQSNNPYIQIKR
jgi:hypothetical protein